MGCALTADLPQAAEVDAMEGPALGVLLGLERDGFSVNLSPEGVLLIAPRGRLTPARMALILTVKADLKLLVRVCTDQGIQARRDAFRREYEALPAGALPAFKFTAGVVYTAGTCFSCGETLPGLTFARCRRCRIGVRLACRLPVPIWLAEARDCPVLS